MVGGQIHATFTHPGHQVSIAQFVGEVPADLENHDFLVKVTTLAQRFPRYEPPHPFILPEPDSDLHQNQRGNER
jgi:hypothetical protein